MPNSKDGLRLYPIWVTVDPVFAKELLASIGYKCRIGEALNDEERKYLAEAIDKMLGSPSRKGIPPARALRLTGHMGAKLKTLSDRNINIYNRVEELLAKGKSKNAAFKAVAAESLAAKKRFLENLSHKAVEKIYSAVQVEVCSENTRKRKVGRG